MATLKSSARFWDEKARENAPWYISTYGSYAERSEGEFWESGARIWCDLKTRVGYRPRPEDVVVEIGCGIGRLTRVLAAEVGRVHAFDISSEMVRRARQAGLDNAEFHLTEGDSLHPLVDGCADLVLAYCVFQHLPNRKVFANYMQEMARVARRGGLVVFTTTPVDKSAWLMPLARLRAVLRSRIQREGPRGLHQKEWVGIRPSRREVMALCPIPLQHAAMDRDRWLFWGRNDL